jgi:hypothetical protein
MYRCYLIRNGRIVEGDDLDVETPAAAVARGRRLIAERSNTAAFSGLEIWCGASLVYSDRCYADDTRSPSAIDSPFLTRETTILPNWRPSSARPILLTPPAGEQPAQSTENAPLARLRKMIRRKPGRSGSVAA